jgi:tetratricopeptide (TPR) repeat protein
VQPRSACANRSATRTSAGRSARLLLLLLACAPRLVAAAGAPCAGPTDAPDVAIAHCTAALEDVETGDVERASSLTRRALAWFAKRDLEKATADLDEALRLNAGSFWAYNSRGVVLMQKGDADGAIADFDSAIGLKPDYRDALANRGNAWLVRGDPDKALTDLGRAIDLAPARPELALSGRGRAWLAKGEFDRAEEDFAAALKANPTYANAISGRGYARFCRGQFDAAATDFAQEHRLRADAESAIAWVIAARRAGRDAKEELAEVSRGDDAKRGMSAGLALFAGTLTPAQTLQAVSDPDPRLRRTRSCAANFHVAEWYLVQHDSGRAMQFLEAARSTCDRSQPEYAAAGAELGRLGSR